MKAIAEEPEDEWIDGPLLLKAEPKLSSNRWNSNR